MIASRIDQHLHHHQSALRLRVARQEALASNIANADTPHYKARDIDFAASLKKTLAGDRGVSLARTDGAHIAAPEPLLVGQPLLYRGAVQPAIDGNSVDLDVERAAFADNAVHIEALLAFINHDLRTALAAVQSQ